jgi:site-specific DNA recombinase
MAEGASRPARKRCAIYTRKSSEEGLEQSFNSLHAQREACEAYIASQKHEGWILMDQAYDDGGLSGGSMLRPALQALLEDIRARRIDIVLVYKVDRLTRSLADFAKLTELFDTHDVSFVSVTQQFNTSTSMGRLTLNVLLSFAQFEREVAGERIRDKIALSKQRGMWMGGLVPIGYDAINKQLVVNETEAQTVRDIYHRYLDCSSVAELRRRLDQEGILSKRRTYAKGKSGGGVPITRGALYQILRNRLYRGEIEHRGQVHKGNHQAIIEPDLWDQVQARLINKGQRARIGTGRSLGKQPQRNKPALLAGLAFDGSGNRLTPSHANNHGKRYRYYVSAPLVRGTKIANGIRVPMGDLEQLVQHALSERLIEPAWLIGQLGAGLATGQAARLIAAGRQLSQQLINPDQQLMRSLIERIVVDRESVTLSLKARNLFEYLATNEQVPADIQPTTDRIDIAISAHRLRCGKQVRLIIGQVKAEQRRVDPQLIRLVADAKRWFKELKAGKRHSIAHIARVEKRETSDISRSLSLAFLAPDIIDMILKGEQPVTLTRERLRAARPLPACWSEQRTLLLDRP